MKLTEKINFRQPKYMLPLIIYIPLLFLGYFCIKFFTIEKAEAPTTAETTEYFNDKLPEANIKGDGIGDKYTNMLNDFGKIKDESAVENIDRSNDKLQEDYSSQYSDAEIAALDQNSQEAQESLEKLRKIQEDIKKQQEKDNRFSDDRTGGNTQEEDETLESLKQALAEAQNESKKRASSAVSDFEEGSAVAGAKARNAIEQREAVDPNVIPNEKAVNEISEETQAEQVVKQQQDTCGYFNTISDGIKQSKLIKAIVDEDIKAVDGSRVRLRLLDDIEIGGRTIPKGYYLYCTMSGFGQQRVKGTVKSLLFNDELVKVNLSLYDTDGMEGLYVPKSSFNEATKNIASGAFQQTMNLNDGSSNSSNLGRWGMQTLQNTYQKVTNAISKNIRTNKAKIKYGTQVYLVNSREVRNNR